MDTIREARIIAARNSMYEYAKLTRAGFIESKFYEVLYGTVQDWALGKTPYDNLILTVPPQHGKSWCVSTILHEWMLGRSSEDNIYQGIVGSYASEFADGFSRKAKKTVTSSLYEEIFGKKAISSLAMGNIELQDGSFFATAGRDSPVTGKPCTHFVIDDLFKNMIEAYSPTIRDNAYGFYQAVASTRLRNGGKKLITFTRWHEDDVIGRVLRDEPGLWHQISFPALSTMQSIKAGDFRAGEDEALVPELHSAEKLKQQRKSMGNLFDTIYQQDPKSKDGLLFECFLEHSMSHSCGGIVRIDIADKGEDALFACHYLEAGGTVYIQDMFYDTRNSSITVPLLADFLLRNLPREVIIESNGMGSTYKNMLEMHLKTKGVFFNIKEKHSTLNKEAKILACIFNVTNRIRFPKEWNLKYPGAYSQISRMTAKSISNQNDVADCLSEIAIAEFGVPNTIGHS